MEGDTLPVQDNQLGEEQSIGGFKEEQGNSAHRFIQEIKRA